MDQTPQTPDQSQPAKSKKKVTLAQKREELVLVREHLSRKYQQVLGQIELIDEMRNKGVDIDKIEIESPEGMA